MNLSSRLKQPFTVLGESRTALLKADTSVGPVHQVGGFYEVPIAVFRNVADGFAKRRRRERSLRAIAFRNAQYPGHLASIREDFGWCGFHFLPLSTGVK